MLYGHKYLAGLEMVVEKVRLETSISKSFVGAYGGGTYRFSS